MTAITITFGPGEPQLRGDLNDTATAAQLLDLVRGLPDGTAAVIDRA